MLILSNLRLARVVSCLSSSLVGREGLESAAVAGVLMSIGGPGGATSLKLGISYLKPFKIMQFHLEAPTQLLWVLGVNGESFTNVSTPSCLFGEMCSASSCSLGASDIGCGSSKSSGDP